MSTQEMEQEMEQFKEWLSNQNYDFIKGEQLQQHLQRKYNEYEYSQEMERFKAWLRNQNYDFIKGEKLEQHLQRKYNEYSNNYISNPIKSGGKHYKVKKYKTKYNRSSKNKKRKQTRSKKKSISKINSMIYSHW